MTEFMLVIAFLAPASNGPGGEAAREPVTLVARFEGEWAGTQLIGTNCPSQVRLRGGTLSAYEGRYWVDYLCAIKVTGPGQLQVTEYLRHPCLGIYRVEAGQIRLCFDMRPGKRPSDYRPDKYTVILKLRPAS